MKAVEITSYGAPEVLRLGERPDPIAGPGELLIRVAASGINRPDVLQRTGNYPVPPGASDLPGLEVAGTIVDGDAQALAQAGLNKGDRVCALVAGIGGNLDAIGELEQAGQHEQLCGERDHTQIFPALLCNHSLMHLYLHRLHQQIIPATLFLLQLKF